MKAHRDAAKMGMHKKIASYGGSSKGIGSSFEAAEPVGSEQRESKPDKEPGVSSIRMAKCGGRVNRLDQSPRTGRATGGRVWEGSKEDKAEDKALAKKHGMSLKTWEKSDADKKHDAREERASGGRVGKGKTTVNIVLNGAGGQPPAPPAPAPMMRPPMPPAPPPPPPPMPPQGPMGAPMPGGPPVPPMGGPSVVNPLQRAKGGRVNPDVPVKSPGKTSEGYTKMDYAALGGKGRRQKILAQD